MLYRSAIFLDVVATSALILYVTRVALGYKQTWDRYQVSYSVFVIRQERFLNIFNFMPFILTLLSYQNLSCWLTRHFMRKPWPVDLEQFIFFWMPLNNSKWEAILVITSWCENAVMKQNEKLSNIIFAFINNALLDKKNLEVSYSIFFISIYIFLDHSTNIFDLSWICVLGFNIFFVEGRCLSIRWYYSLQIKSC